MQPRKKGCCRKSRKFTSSLERFNLSSVEGRQCQGFVPSCIFTSVPSDRKDEEQRDQDHIPAARRREAWAIPCGRSGSPLAQLCCPALPKTPGFQDLLVVQAPDLLLGLQDLKGVLLVYTQNAHLDVWWLELR